jgi:exonuclease SbcC
LGGWEKRLQNSHDWSFVVHIGNSKWDVIGEVLMIDSIEISNFQSHEHATLDFLPGVNVIKGTSHQGKSSIMRALRWALFNYPRGENFKSHFAKDRDSVDVGVGFTDDQWVLRVKINYQRQGDEYFLLDKSPGFAGKMLNEFVGLQIIDESRTTINRMIRDFKSQVELTKVGIEHTEKQLKNFKHLDEAIKLVDKITEKQETLSRLEERAVNLHEIDAQVAGIQEALEETKGWLEVKEEFESLTKQFSGLSKLKTQYVVISDVYSDIRKCEKSFRNASQELERDNKRYSELEKQLNYCQKCGAHKKYWKKVNK